MFLPVIVLVLGVSLCLTLAQQGDERTVELTREMVDALLQVLSPPCRVEMEGALASQMEISDECKFEIQRTLASFQSGQNVETQEDFSNPTQAQDSAMPAAAVQSSVGSPVIAIVVFIVVAIAAVAGCVVYVNSQRGDKSVLKPKKLSKKKVR